MTQKQLDQIEELAKNYLKDPLHDFSHVSRVKQNAEKIVSILGIENNIDLNLLQATCLLHDLAWTELVPLPPALVYIFEGILAKISVAKTIKPLDITSWERKTILKAISRHSKSFPFKKLNKKADLYTKILQDADSLDLLSEQRTENLKKINNLPKIICSLINLFASYGRKNIDKFLNFPELAPYFSRANVFSYLEWGKTNLEKKTLLCIHGYADSSSMFAPFAKILDSRYKIIGLDLPMRQGTKIYSIAELVNYLENFRKKINLEKFNLMGFSLGGLVAIEYSIKHPDSVSNLYVLNSAPSLLLSNISKKLFKYLRPLLLLRPNLYIYSHIGTNRFLRKLLSIPALSNEQQRIMKCRYISIFGTLFNNLNYAKTKEFNELPLSKTVILFKDDEILKWSYVNDYAKSLKTKLRIFDKGGHATKNEYWPNIAKLF